MLEWRDDAFVLRVRAFGEGKLLAEVFAREQGRCGGLAHSHRRAAPLLQPGNLISASWRARSADQLGVFTSLEMQRAYAAQAMQDQAALAAISSAAELIRAATPERQAYPSIFAALEILMEELHEPEIWPALYARFELGLLAALGYGLDLSCCALTGDTSATLRWVSPRSGRAASDEAARDFTDKLLRLPPFLTETSAALSSGDVADAFALAGFFLERRVFDRHGLGLPDARRRLIEALGHSARL